AWDLVNRDELESRDTTGALAAARETVELDSLSVHAWQNLGWVEYRAGNWDASIEALEKSCELQTGGDCCQWIVMALAHEQLAVDAKLSEAERSRHQAEGRRLYTEAAK